ncbi:hypothetical protein PanWU01x14_154090 [Parasponia andersonii]|uniref:Uncharacterized protein n=1 Tax=Parasponia andersonii TaxID=3476 RepID=A0A2P5CGS0_PARAD|nr:hypothetical protein PanWU01x14_154090 [Parasponia andersonii]
MVGRTDLVGKWVNEVWEELHWELESIKGSLQKLPSLEQGMKEILGKMSILEKMDQLVQQLEEHSKTEELFKEQAQKIDGMGASQQEACIEPKGLRVLCLGYGFVCKGINSSSEIGAQKDGSCLDTPLPNIISRFLST